MEQTYKEYKKILTKIISNDGKWLETKSDYLNDLKNLDNNNFKIDYSYATKAFENAIDLYILDEKQFKENWNDFLLIEKWNKFWANSKNSFNVQLGLILLSLFVGKSKLNKADNLDNLILWTRYIFAERKWNAVYLDIIESLIFDSKDNFLNYQKDLKNCKSQDINNNDWRFREKIETIYEELLKQNNKFRFSVSYASPNVFWVSHHRIFYFLIKRASKNMIYKREEEKENTTQINVFNSKITVSGTWDESTFFKNKEFNLILENIFSSNKDINKENLEKDIENVLSQKFKVWSIDDFDYSFNSGLAGIIFIMLLFKIKFKSKYFDTRILELTKKLTDIYTLDLSFQYGLLGIIWTQKLVKQVFKIKDFDNLIQKQINSLSLAYLAINKSLSKKDKFFIYKTLKNIKIK
ncbi:hypothetical protein [Mycoplasma buteonis]|uniref:hypothetical protein n=1 Tax=Mycoplasma buteonis TaxID=171280 RepID=UPI000568AE84|nr:hypothetical protein [Mycoplasma buteonis]